MIYFLWFIAIVGAWNFINLLARLYYNCDWSPYSFHVLIGFWADYLLWGHYYGN